jgi:hypothetical protein
MTPPNRAPTSTEGIRESLAAKVQRDAEARAKLAIPHEVVDPVTALIPAGPDRDAARAKRPTEQRIKHLEDRADLLVDELIASRAFVRTFLLKVLGILSLVVAAYYYGRHG